MRAKLSIAILAVALMVGLAPAYTNLWVTPYFSYQLMGGTAKTTTPNNVDAPVNFCTIMETLHVAVHVGVCTLTVTNANGVYDPLIWCLDGTVGVKIGLPVAVNSNTYTPFGPFADSTAVQLAGHWKKFILYISATADSVQAHGYVMVGSSAPSIQNTHLK